MTAATYGPRINVHPDRYGARKSGPNRLLVVHTSEGGESPTAAENLGAFMTMPGDRPSSSGGRYGASYHYVTDTDRVLPAVPDDVVAYAAAGANSDGIHICIPGKAGQTRAEWLDTTSRSYIRQCAAVLVDKAREHRIPLDRLSVGEIVVGIAGYCGHVDISNAYHQSDHSDPGAQFPWDVLAADIAALTQQEDDDMTPLATPERAYDSRPTEQAGVNPTLAVANKLVPLTPFAAGEQRAIVIGMTNRAFVHVTVIGTAPGYVEIAGTPFTKPPTTSLANVDADGVTSGGGPVATPEGKVYVWATAPCDIAIDVRARG